MITWQYGSTELQRYAREKAPTEDDLAGLVAQPKSTIRSPGTAIFFSDSYLLVTPEFGVWKMIQNFHILPLRTVLLSIQIVGVPFVSPTQNGSTALRVKTLGNGIYSVTAIFGYAQEIIDAKVIATDIIYELNRLETLDNNNNSKVMESLSSKAEEQNVIQTIVQEQSQLEQKIIEESILYLISYQQLAPPKGAHWGHKLRIATFNLLAMHASNFSDFSSLPYEQTTEIGHTIIL